MEEKGWHWLEAEARAAGLRLRLLERNWRWRGGELDLIYEEQDPRSGTTLVICEVRCRFTPGIDPVETLTWKKQSRLLATTRRFLAVYRGKPRGLRIDLLAWNGDWRLRRNVLTDG